VVKVIGVCGVGFVKAVRVRVSISPCSNKIERVPPGGQMNRVATLALFGVLSVVPCFAQTNQTDSQTLRDILTEMRAIHNEVRLSESTQILLTELGIQQTAVNRATERRDELRSRVSQSQTNQRELTLRLTRAQESADAATTPETKKNFVDMQENLKSSIASLKRQELEQSNNLQEAESLLRKEQLTLDDIQAQLNDVVKKLQPASNR
jgi:exonuclease VII small subunit